MRSRVREYAPEWRAVFDALRAPVVDALGPVAVAVEQPFASPCPLAMQSTEPGIGPSATASMASSIWWTRRSRSSGPERDTRNKCRSVERMRGQWWRPRLELRARDLEVFQGIPSARPGAVSLRIKRGDRDLGLSMMEVIRHGIRIREVGVDRILEAWPAQHPDHARARRLLVNIRGG